MPAGRPASIRTRWFTVRLTIALVHFWAPLAAAIYPPASGTYLMVFAAVRARLSAGYGY
jgi:hypothetical protein